MVTTENKQIYSKNRGIIQNSKKYSPNSERWQEMVSAEKQKIDEKNKRNKGNVKPKRNISRVILNVNVLNTSIERLLYQIEKQNQVYSAY